jgi:hypothetical protein
MEASTQFQLIHNGICGPRIITCYTMGTVIPPRAGLNDGIEWALKVGIYALDWRRRSSTDS